MNLESQKNYNIGKGERQYPKTLMKISKLKKQNETIIKNLLEIGETNTAMAIKFCANMVTLQEVGKGERITQANFCRQRLCAICAWRKSLKWVAQTKPVLNQISLERENPRYIFITVTIKNIAANQVDKAINQLLKSWDRFCKLKEIKESFDGIIRSTEITYNAYQKNYHPHIHALVLCNENYFKKFYITQNRLKELWKSAAKLDYNPIVDIKAVTTEAGIPKKATIETLKYAIKPTAYKMEATVTQTLLYALKNRRLISYSGEFAKIRRKLKMEDLESIDLCDVKMQTTPEILYAFTPNGWEVINERGEKNDER